MSLRFEEETNVYDEGGDLLGQTKEGNLEYFPTFFAVKDAGFTPDELREIADYLENQ